MARDKITNHREAVNIVTCPSCVHCLYWEASGSCCFSICWPLSLKAAIYATVIL